MQSVFATAAVTERLLHEVANVTVSFDPVLFFYTSGFACAAMLWTIGVVTFGRPRAIWAQRATAQAGVTPVVP